MGKKYEKEKKITFWPWSKPSAGARSWPTKHAIALNFAKIQWLMSQPSPLKLSSVTYPSLPHCGVPQSAVFQSKNEVSDQDG